MSKREIKTIFFSIGSVSLIIEGEFLFKRDVSHLSFCSRRQVVPRHGACWEHPVFLRTPEESRLSLSTSRVRTKMISRSTVIQNALAFKQIPFSRQNWGWAAPTLWQKLAKEVEAMLGQFLGWPRGRKDAAWPHQKPAASQGLEKSGKAPGSVRGSSSQKLAWVHGSTLVPHPPAQTPFPASVSFWDMTGIGSGFPLCKSYENFCKVYSRKE